MILLMKVLDQELSDRWYWWIVQSPLQPAILINTTSSNFLEPNFYFAITKKAYFINAISNCEAFKFWLASCCFIALSNAIFTLINRLVVKRDKTISQVLVLSHTTGYWELLLGIINTKLKSYCLIGAINTNFKWFPSSPREPSPDL